MTKSKTAGAKTRRFFKAAASLIANTAVSTATALYETPRDFIDGLVNDAPLPPPPPPVQAIPKRRRRAKA